MKLRIFKSYPHRFILPVLFLFLSFASYGKALTDSVQTNGFRIHTVVVDAGHGGKDPGAYGANSNEKTITLSLALKLQKAIERDLPDVKVIMTRTTDTFVELHKRADIANKNQGQLFISLHCNSLANRTSTELVGYKKGKGGKNVPVYKTVSVPNRSGKGAMILVYGSKRVGAQEEALRENAVIYAEKDYKDNYAGYDPNNPASVILLNTFRDKYRKQSIRLATLIDTEFTETDGRRSAGVKEQVVLVLDHTAMPAVLIETGFINNPDDEDYLTSDEGQAEMVNSIVRALKNYKKQVEN
ncbi:N-acetylmuramoyl-L-alanine amidase [Mucilaginibacter hurinus]|uniref:N-acetylmuramoyl-L-alanine amidase n=1 Tax=Mucilaginibacter hurinus TaxID=2201324 RepID=A0A367GL70_9SPHI|nr:N-acetylmuramoyl-L-alanine amidase [Mucilaginibacter hurinus]RCH53586.1 N-acetylmuramoyl-L-alanine amidase [Mucilaginibacter hurinus]